MVVYHSINYSAFRTIAFQFFAFLPLAFIMITGFLVSHVYAANYDLRTWRPYGRLVLRGAKLFLLFAILNLAYSIGLNNDIVAGTSQFLAHSSAIFVSGNDRSAIFEVLLPIAYFLLLAPLLLWLRSHNGALLISCALFVFLLCFGLETAATPIRNLGLLSVGIVGMALGLLDINTVDRFARRWMAVIFLYLLYRLASSVFGESYAVQLFASVVGVLFIYCCALHQDLQTWFQRQMILFGHYSLVAYLLQIALLQVAIKVLGGKPETPVGVLALTLLTVSFTYMSVLVIHGMRRQSRPIDVLYRAAFA